jgi:hypothetical protein
MMRDTAEAGALTGKSPANLLLMMPSYPYNWNFSR